MERTAQRSVFVKTSIAAPLASEHRELLRAAADCTADELTVFVSLDGPAAHGEAGWSQMQHCVADLYGATVSRSFPDQHGPATCVVFLDFCAYAPEDMERYKRWPACAVPRDLPAVPAWWPAEMRSGIIAHPPSAHAAESSPPAVHAGAASSTRTAIPWASFAHVAVGGTFDHLHIGHKILLTATALAATKRVVCGISADALLENKRHKELIEPYRARELKVLLFLRRIRKDLIVELAPIVDRYGPTAVDASLGALVLSQETLRGAEALNVAREEKHMPPMRMLTIDMLDPLGDGGSGSDRLISSSAIRAALAERQRAGSRPAV
ncbi:hypothetical protein H4R19_004977 [Coemansia spiralis]|nr:hypothetical protein H4R19_004977 [Coemansia spiralis]